MWWLQGRKAFFFEKKKQKTFAHRRTRSISNWATDAKEQKFFGSFFQKRTPFCPGLATQGSQERRAYFFGVMT
jgi:hypothetical protein